MKTSTELFIYFFFVIYLKTERKQLKNKNGRVDLTMRIAAAAVIQFHLKIPFLEVIVRMAGWLAAI